MAPRDAKENIMMLLLFYTRIPEELGLEAIIIIGNERPRL